MGRTPSRFLAVVAAGLVAAGAAAAADLANLLPGLEQDSLSLRFDRRGAQPSPGLLVVAIDDKTFSDTGMQWPFKRSVHGQAIDRLRRDGARAIVYDVQFTEPTTPRQDLALAGAVARARGHNVVLATAETDEHGHTNVLGGDRNVRERGAHVGASNLPPGRNGVLQRFRASEGGLATLAVVTARLLGRPPPASAFPDGGAFIDFRGPPGTIDTVSFSDLIAGRVRPSRIRGHVVVVGAAAPTLQDVHPTPTSDRPMSGAEIEANAIYTALHGMPLRETPTWVDLLVVLGLGLLPALLSLALRAVWAALLAPVIAVVYVIAAQVAFDHGRILPVATPLFALALGTLCTVLAGYLAERHRRRQATQRNEVLEAAVLERTAELRATQLEVIHRLAQATESRDEETGLHLWRISRMCERVGLALGMSKTDAETLRNASLLHDVGKIGVPDSVLSKPGMLTPEDWEAMRRHTTVGSSILAGSSSPVVRMAEEIARTHHERWDGSGYPAGLRGEEIPLAGRICAVCDVFDALQSARPYKQPWPVPDALTYVRRERGRHFDPVVVDAFLSIVDDLEPDLLAGERRAEPAQAVAQADPAGEPADKLPGDVDREPAPSHPADV
jgi:CHASE2 domain-containing sensor protein